MFVPSVEKGVGTACKEGILAGFRVTDVKADFYDGKMHPVDSKDIAFQIAGREAFKEAFMDAGPVLLEPIMDVKITVPEAMMGDIMGDISGRRGRVIGTSSDGKRTIVIRLENLILCRICQAIIFQPMASITTSMVARWPDPGLPTFTAVARTRTVQSPGAGLPA